MSAFKWLIEAPGQQYLTARKIGGSYTFKWTKDHWLALRFMNEEQADLTMMAIRELDRELFGFAVTLGDAKATEHAWLTQTADASLAQPQVTEETLRNTLADHFARHDIRELDIRMLRNKKLLRSRLPEYCLAALEALESALARPDGERG